MVDRNHNFSSLTKLPEHSTRKQKSPSMYFARSYALVVSSILPLYTLYASLWFLLYIIVTFLGSHLALQMPKHLILFITYV